MVIWKSRFKGAQPPGAGGCLRQKAGPSRRLLDSSSLAFKHAPFRDGWRMAATAGVMLLTMFASSLITPFSSVSFSAHAKGKKERRIETRLEVPVLMFHSVQHAVPAGQERFNVTPAQFRLMLDSLYARGYFAISAKELVEKDFSRVPSGKTPVLFTFDDARPSQFLYQLDSKGRIRKNKDGSPLVDPQCALGLLTKFFYDHPDFGFGALFSISFDSGILFGQK